MEIAFLLVALAVGVLAGTTSPSGWTSRRPSCSSWSASWRRTSPECRTIHLTADVVLFGLLPPLLYAAAIQTSLVDFNANRRPILLLSVGLVAVHDPRRRRGGAPVLPGVSWALAFAIGAVVAPPDAVAATAIGRRIGLPRRIVTILEGESLLNDATALVALRTALAAGDGGVSPVAGRRSTSWSPPVGGVADRLRRLLVVAPAPPHLTDPVLDIALSLVVPFAAYIVAEELHAVRRGRGRRRRPAARATRRRSSRPRSRGSPSG